MTNEHLKRILFIDIETVPIVSDFGLLSENMKNHWERKARTFKTDPGSNTDLSVLFGERAGIYSEFSKVVCIGIGTLTEDGGEWKMRLKSICDHDEKVLLNNFNAILSRFLALHPEMKFCGHNIREFDIPFLCRRMIINDVPLATCMQLNAKKPWEQPNIDTLELWKFCDYKSFTSLALLAEVLGIPSPKNDMDGSMVGEVYWQQSDIDRIGKYCLQDVLTTMKVLLRLVGRSDIQPTPVYIND